jgi:hypothetical protein
MKSEERKSPVKERQVEIAERERSRRGGEIDEVEVELERHWAEAIDAATD